MKKVTTTLLIIVAALTFTAFANAGIGCCAIPQKAATHATSNEKTATLHIEGMTCGSCATAVKQVLRKIDGVKEANVSFAEKKGVVTYDAKKVTPEQLARAVAEKLPYKATVVK